MLHIISDQEMVCEISDPELITAASPFDMPTQLGGTQTLTDQELELAAIAYEQSTRVKGTRFFHKPLLQTNL